LRGLGTGREAAFLDHRVALVSVVGVADRAWAQTLAPGVDLYLGVPASGLITWSANVAIASIFCSIEASRPE